MLELLVLMGRAVALACRGHHELVLENVALRQQLRAAKRRAKRPYLRERDRLFWIVVARAWRNCRTALVLVQPDTVVRWHRDCTPTTFWRTTPISLGACLQYDEITLIFLDIVKPWSIR